MRTSEISLDQFKLKNFTSSKANYSDATEEILNAQVNLLLKGNPDTRVPASLDRHKKKLFRILKESKPKQEKKNNMRHESL